jgi:ferredoxin
MKIASLKLACFSPTGTTRTVLEGIARGMDCGEVELIDITTPEARRVPLRTAEDDLLVVGVPVYMGRVPALLADWLGAIEADKTPAVAVAVYGNRVYDDTLIELRDFLTAGGCRTIAGGAFIGEHSFSTDETPTAAGRPDPNDLALAEAFGERIREKVLSAPSVDEIPEVTLPGCRPYRSDPTLWQVDFIDVGDGCTRCGVCAEVCPVGAIDPDDSAVIDTTRCITCCACIRRCPEGIRTMKPGLVQEAAVRLSTLYAGRKEPEVFV